MIKLPVIGLVLLAALVLGGPAEAQTVLKFSHPYTERDTRHQWAAKIAELAAQKTSNRVTLQVFPNQQLFKARAQYDGLVNNQIDVAIYPLPWLGGKARLAEIGAIPGLISTPEDGVIWRQRQIWPMLEEAVASTGVVFAGGGWAMGTIGNKGNPILTPADMRGHKMRGLGKATEKMMAANGATVTSLPASEIYSGLQTGVLTAVLTIDDSFEGYNLHEVLDHLLAGRGFVGAMHAILLAPQVKSKVGAADYAALLEAVAESEPWFAERAAANTARIATLFESKGVKVHRLTAAQQAVWQRDAETNAWPFFRETVPNGDAALKAINLPR